MSDKGNMGDSQSQPGFDGGRAASVGSEPSAARPPPLGWQDNRLCAGEGKLSAESILSAANILWGRRFDADRPSAADLAQRFHETYERLAPSFGYETREASAKPWADVPEQNKALMVAVCAEILGGTK